MICDMESVNGEQSGTEEMRGALEDIAVQIASIVIDNHLWRCRHNNIQDWQKCCLGYSAVAASSCI